MPHATCLVAESEIVPGSLGISEARGPVVVDVIRHHFIDTERWPTSIEAGGLLQSTLRGGSWAGPQSVLPVRFHSPWSACEGGEL